MLSTRRSPASGSLSRRRTRKEAEKEVVLAPARSPASGDLSRRRTRNEVEEVVAPEFGKDEEGGDSLSGPNTRRATLRKRSDEGGISSVGGSSSERPRRRRRKEANVVVSAAENVVEEEVEVSEDGTKVEGDTLFRCCTHSQDVPRNSSSGERPPASKSSLKSQSRKGKNVEEIIVLDVNGATSDGEDLEVEVDEGGFEEEGDDEEIEVGEEVMDSGRKPRVVAIRKSAQGEDAECRFIGQPIKEKEAKERWPKRHQGKAKVKGKQMISSLHLWHISFLCRLLVWIID